jgi:hypothetical protein
MASPPLYKLPVALRQYKTERVASPSEPCSLCWRDFGQKNDPSDRNETPCLPLEIFPCRHVFGSHCLQLLKRSGTTICPACRTRLEVPSSAHLDTVHIIANHIVSKSIIDFTTQYIREYTDPTTFNALSQELFAGTFTLSGTCTLWWLYVRAWLKCITRIGFIWVMRNALLYYGIMAIVTYITRETPWWPRVYSYLTYAKSPTTYREIVRACVENAWMVVTGFVEWGGLGTVLFGALIAMLVWAGAPWPQIELFTQHQEPGEGQSTFLEGKVLEL